MTPYASESPHAFVALSGFAQRHCQSGYSQKTHTGCMEVSSLKHTTRPADCYMKIPDGAPAGNVHLNEFDNAFSQKSYSNYRLLINRFADGQLHSQLLAAARAPTLQHIATTRGPHALSKAVCFQAFSHLWLPCSLWHDLLLNFICPFG